MSKSTKSLIDQIDANPGVDNSETFEALWALLGELFEKVQSRFELSSDASTEDLRPYEAIDGSGAGGYLSTYVGPEIDWLVYSWVGNPKMSFTNMHLTVSLGPQVDAPNLGLAFGTTPDLFVYIDYSARKDLASNPEYMDKYYVEANQQYLDWQENPDFTSFISRDLYMRVTQTPTSLCISAPDSEENMAEIRQVSHKMVDQWIANVDKADAIPVADRPAQMARDEKVRRSVADRDPMNEMVQRMYGKDQAERLTKALWGGDRVLPRPE